METKSNKGSNGSLAYMNVFEFVASEDWPLVLNNFHRALKPDGYLYFTVELIEAEERTHAYSEGRKQGLPVVEGEYALEGSYHYYPEVEQVRMWVSQAGFFVIQEGEGDDYHHFLVQRSA